MLSGECNCGAVQFEIDAEPSGIYLCHCSICRRSTGSNGIAVVVVPKERFRWLRGQELISTWQKPGTQWQTWFCRVCGSPVPGIPSIGALRDVERLELVQAGDRTVLVESGRYVGAPATP